jgi:serine/threonine-protein kinase
MAQEQEQHKQTPAADVPDSLPGATTLIDLPAGMVLNGRYLIERELGRGGIGTVYLARDQQLLSKPVVIKVLLQASLQNEWVVNKFRQEMEALTRVEHPGIVSVLDAGETPDGKPYLVMQYVPGVNLRSLIRTEGMDLAQTARLMRQIGSALSAAHDKGVLHRDLKPENIMLHTTSDGEEQVKLIDFGIAKIKDSVVAPSTATALTVGTIAYMAPEQLKAEPVSAASDVYALGVIAYEMVAGRRPFNPDSMFELLEMQRDGVKIKPKDLRPRLPETAQEIILKALSFNPAERYQRARDFGVALASALDTEANPINPPEEVRRDGVSAAGNISSVSAQVENQQARESAAGKNYVFISYSTKDKRTADAVCTALEKKGHECWIAPRNIIPGMDWSESIIEALSASRVMVLILSANANESTQIKREAELAVNAHVPIIPFRIEDVVPSKALKYFLSTTHWLDAFTPPLERHLPYLADTVSSIKNRQAGVAPMPLPAPVPRPNGRLPIYIGSAVLLVVLALGAALLLWRNHQPTSDSTNGPKPTAPQERTLNYWVEVQKYRDGKPDKEPFRLANEIMFQVGDHVWFDFNSPQSGYLYIVNEGPETQNNLPEYNVLFPTPTVNNNSSALAANQTLRIPGERGFKIDNERGMEKIWVIWSAQRIEELEAIAAQVVTPELRGSISKPEQIKWIQSFIASQAKTAPQEAKDDERRVTTLRGAGDIIVSLRKLEHY